MKRVLLAATCLLLAAASAVLGAWQIERRTWKLDLIARVDARVAAVPRALPSNRAWSADMAYTRVRASGRFFHDRETLVQAVTDRGPGWWVLTPLRTTRTVVLVNRGFVPSELRDPSRRDVGQVRGLVMVTGLLRATEPRGAFLHNNDPEGGRWYSRDVAAIARARKLGDVAPFFIDADATPNPGGYPVGGLTVLAFRNGHLVYAMTWFALCGLSLFGAFMVLVRL